MDGLNFRIIVNLSNFFNDHRSSVKIFINKETKTVQDVIGKLEEFFDIHDIDLISEDCYLPPTEDIRILQPNEVICAVPKASNRQSLCKSTSKKKNKEKNRKSHEQEQQIVSDNTEIAKKKKKRSLNLENARDTVESSDDAKNCTHTVIPKKKKKRHKDIEVEVENGYECNISNNEESTKVQSKLQNENTPEEIKNKKSTRPVSEITNGKDHSESEKEHICKGDLSTYVKKYPIPTITEQYLSQKPINIVKIDVISKKPEPSKVQSPQSEKNNFEHEKRYFGEFSHITSIVHSSCEQEKLTAQANNEKQSSVENDNHVNNISEKQGNNASEQTESVDRSSNPETNKKSDLLNVPKPKYFFFNSPSSTPEISHKETNSTEKGKNQTGDSQKYRQKYFMLQSPVEAIDSKTIEKTVSTPIRANASEPHNDSNKCEEIVEKDTSCDISKLFSSNDLSETSSIHKSISAISGLQDLPSSETRHFLKPKQYTGVGLILEELKSNHSSPCSSTDASDISAFVTKRKRKRVRKRKIKPVPTVCTTPLSSSYNSSEINLNTKACPSVHVKFEYDNEDEGKIKVINVNEEKDAENIETINITSDIEPVGISESTILKAPLMEKIGPKVGDIIAFQVLRISESYSPEQSNFIVAKVLELENNNLVLDIISGHDQCQQPSGKFSVENEDINDRGNLVNNRITFNWQELICPRLLYP